MNVVFVEPSGSSSAFRAFAKSNNVDLSCCTPRAGIDQMFAFYQSVAAEGCDAPDGDMLLFQWGTYDGGVGKYFELNITRQFIEPEDEESVTISQLGLTFRFETTPEWVALGAANRWCGDQAESAIARDFVFSSPAFMAVADQKALSIELAHSFV